MLIYRLRGNFLYTMDRMFGRDIVAISRISTSLALLINHRWGHLLTWESWIRFAEPRLEAYVTALRECGVPDAMGCFGFVDGKLARTDDINVFHRHPSPHCTTITR